LFLGETTYLLARDLTTSLGQPILYLILALSITLAIFAVFPKLRDHARFVSLALFLTLTAGWLLLAYFHQQISVSLVLSDPTGQLPPGRFYIPPYIENEKFYFWTLVLAALVVLNRHRDRAWRAALHGTLAIFGIVTYFTSNPFAEPLAQFHAGWTQYAAATAGNANIMIQSQAYHSLHGRMEGLYNSPYMWIHPPMLFIAYATFVVAFVGSIFMLAKKIEYEKLAYAYAKPGYILLTIGILIGYPWAVQAWSGEPWWYDPKINLTLMMWVFYSAYLHARLYMHRPGMKVGTALTAYFSFLAVVVTYVSTYVIPGIHAMG
jgi:cytochrome c biogenesis factor